jgi:hypothetical protein
MVDPAMHEILLPLRLHLISCSNSGRPGGTLPRKMASQPTLETCSTSTVSLRWCTVRGWALEWGLEGLTSVSETESEALVLASAAGSSGVA